jgi:transcriptional regulator with XRE-family HTH domain
MELGQQLKQARLEAGLSQRQLCGDAITRKMLSRIENGSARPSMDTLALLAQRLGRPVSYFLSEDGLYSPNQTRLQNARGAFCGGAYQQALRELEDFSGEDPLLDPEKHLLQVLCLLELAREAVTQGRLPFAQHLLEEAWQAGEKTPYFVPELRRRWLLLGAEAGREEAISRLPSMDEELLLRAEVALEQGDNRRCVQLLDAAQEQAQPRWRLLRGEAAASLGQYDRAAAWLAKAEEAYPERAIPLLERCYRELGDYKMAYVYACKQKK